MNDDSELNISSEGECSDMETDDDVVLITLSKLQRGSKLDWFTDSGCTRHICANPSYILRKRPLHRRHIIVVGNGQTVEPEAECDVLLYAWDAITCESHEVEITDVLYVPSMMANLISVHQLNYRGFSALFEGSHKDKQKPDSVAKGVIFNSDTFETLMTFSTRNKQSCIDLAYTLDAAHLTSNELKDEKYLTLNYGLSDDEKESALIGEYDQIELPGNLLKKGGTSEEDHLGKLWHQRLGHAHEKVIKLACKRGHISSKINGKLPHCRACAEGKGTRTSRRTRGTRAKEILEIVHSDTAGPVTPLSTRNQFRYFQVYVDDKSRYITVSFLKQKTETTPKTKRYWSTVERQTERKLKRFKTDNGTEYNSISLEMRDAGVIHEKSAPYTPSQNGTPERAIRILKEKAKCMIHHANAPAHLWAYAVAYSAYIHNRLPSQANNSKSPFEIWNQFPPILDHVLVWGCTIHAIIPHERRDGKFGKNSEMGAFVGFDGDSTNVLVWKRKTNEIFVSADYIADEKDFSSISQTPNIHHEGLKFHEKKDTEKHSRTSGANNSTEESDADSDDCEASSDGGNSNLRDNGYTPNPESDPERDHHPLREHSINNSDDDDEDQRPRNRTPRLTPPRRMRQRGNRRLNPHNYGDIRRSTRVGKRPRRYSGERYVRGRRHQSEEALNVQDVEDSMANDLIEQLLKVGVTDPLEDGNTSRSARSQRTLQPEEYKLKDAINHELHGKEWEASIESELQSLVDMEVFEIVDAPTEDINENVTAKWVFKHKLNPDGSVARFKSRLVARGFTQQYGIDYLETFAPVAKFPSIRLIWSIATQQSWPVHQMDVKTAFLCAEIDYEVYLKLPDGLTQQDASDSRLLTKFSDLKQRILSCTKPMIRLKKGLYGLKQSPRLWYQRFSGHLLNIGYTRSEYDPSLFMREDCLIALYVDDLEIACENGTQMTEIKKGLTSEFAMTDLGLSNFFLGIQICQEIGVKTTLSQSHYIDKILTTFGMENCVPKTTPISQLQRIAVEEDELHDTREYQQAIGSLMYLMLGTRVDIAFAISHLSQFCSKPTEAHWTAVKGVLRYLKGTKDLKLTYFAHGPGENSMPTAIERAIDAENTSQIYGYTDAD